jgi:hypothetical protein
MEVYMRMKVELPKFLEVSGAASSPRSLYHEKSLRYPLNAPLWRREE